MNSETRASEISKLHGHGNTASYLAGFFLSLALTLVAYFLVEGHLLTGKVLICTITLLAGLQVLLQLYFFLHVSADPSERWNLIALLFMVLVVVIVMTGTLWIMYHLDYNMRDPMHSKAAMSDPDRIRTK